jgi:hypothetical protein
MSIINYKFYYSKNKKPNRLYLVKLAPRWFFEIDTYDAKNKIDTYDDKYF